MYPVAPQPSHRKPEDYLPEPEPFEDPVPRWRFGQLMRAGYSPEAALELASRQDVDLHKACALTARGCDPAIAAEILR